MICILGMFSWYCLEKCSYVDFLFLNWMYSTQAGIKIRCVTCSQMVEDSTSQTLSCFFCDDERHFFATYMHCGLQEQGCFIVWFGSTPLSLCSADLFLNVCILVHLRHRYIRVPPWVLAADVYCCSQVTTQEKQVPEMESVRVTSLKIESYTQISACMCLLLILQFACFAKAQSTMRNASEYVEIMYWFGLMVLLQNKPQRY